MSTIICGTLLETNDTRLARKQYRQVLRQTAIKVFFAGLNTDTLPRYQQFIKIMQDEQKSDNVNHIFGVRLGDSKFIKVKDTLS